MIRVHTKNKDVFRLSSFDFITSKGIIKNKEGKIIATIFFTDGSIIAVEQTEDGVYTIG